MDIQNVVRLVEGHSEALAKRWMERIRMESGVEAWLHLPQDELLKRLTDVYREIGIFLDQPRNDVIRHYFFDAGRMRRRQSMPPQDMARGFQLAREIVWEFVQEQGDFDSSVNLYQALNLYRQIVHFFDWALIYGVMGYFEE
jgi:hypothetical protein